MIEKKVTVGEFVKALRKNGYEQTFHVMFSIEDGNFKACALGQAFINLGFYKPRDVTDDTRWTQSGAKTIYDVAVTAIGTQISQFIMAKNDREHWTLEEIANELEARYFANSIDSIAFRAYPLTRTQKIKQFFANLRIK